jgi:1,4-alpha-glucan branching enzyme
MVREFLIGLSFTLFFSGLFGQENKRPVCKVENGEITIEIPNEYQLTAIDSLISHYDLGELDLSQALRDHNFTKAKALGWEIKKRKGKIILQKKMEDAGISDPHYFLGWIFPGMDDPFDQPGVPVMKHSIGFNRFLRTSVIQQDEQHALFIVRDHQDAESVILSGSFNNWSTLGTPMQKSDSGWVVSQRLIAGKHLYKFIVNGKWMTDPYNLQKEPDGFNGHNSVYYQTNTIFRLKGHVEAKKAILSGSFNHWDTQEIELKRRTNGWELPVYLKDGTYHYKFIVDHQWMQDPDNPASVDDGAGGFNSIIAKGDAYKFRLEGYQQATKVYLAGTFNDWNPGELAMQKTASGWELPYVLGPGNYQYKFLVDGTWITDPGNPNTMVSWDGYENSIMTFKGNYTFSLRGYSEAGSVVITGSFNNWDEKGFSMKKIDDQWVKTVYLPPGKTTYKYIVDGKWILDPDNKTWEENEHGTGNSVIWQDFNQ